MATPIADLQLTQVVVVDPRGILKLEYKPSNFHLGIVLYFCVYDFTTRLTVALISYPDYAAFMCEFGINKVFILTTVSTIHIAANCS